MKKLLLCALTAITFIGLTGCQSEKKLSAEEAKTEVKAVMENTAAEVKNAASVSFKADGKATITAKDVKLLASKTAVAAVESAKINASANASIKASANKEDKKAKVTASADAKVDANINSSTLKTMLGWETPKKFNYTAKGEAEVYAVEGAEKTNFYGKYDASINEELAKELGITQTKYSSLFNLASKSINGLFEYGEDLDDEDDEIDGDTTTDLGFIKDWTIFKKKGNTLIADCSNLEAFDLGEDFYETQATLKTYGIEFKVSKFQIGFDKNKVLTSFDFETSVKGNLDLSKIPYDAEAIEDILGEYGSAIASLPIDSMSGTITVDLSAGASFTLGYTPETITVPKDMMETKETDLDEIIDEIISGIFNGGGSKEKAAIKSAENVFAAGKTVLLESAASETPAIEGVVIVGNTYSVGIADLVKAGEIESNPCDPTDSEDGGITVTYDASTAEWSFIASGTIDGYEIFYEDGEFEAYKA